MILSAREREERAAARADEFRAGEISEEVFRACLYALRYRGGDIDLMVRENWPTLAGTR